jgi:hypothetical protein
MSADISYSISKQVTEIVPEDVSRARHNAWLDLISPLTEWAGLKGDQVRYRRQQLRLQQEDNLIRVGLRARQQIERDGRKPEAVPTKALVPLLESASLEDGDSELLELWGNLLASAAIEFGPDVLTCIAILRELGPVEVRLLNDMAAKFAQSGVWSESAERRSAAVERSFIEQRQNLISAFEAFCAGSMPDRDLRSHLARFESVFPAIPLEFGYAEFNRKSTVEDRRRKNSIHQLTIDIL